MLFCSLKPASEIMQMAMKTEVDAPNISRRAEYKLFLIIDLL